MMFILFQVGGNLSAYMLVDIFAAESLYCLPIAEWQYYYSVTGIIIIVNYNALENV